MTLRTVRNLLRCVTPLRLWNLVLILCSYRLSLVLGRPVVWGLPYTLTIEPTNRCNLSCPECPSGNGELVRPLGSMPLEAFTRLVDEITPRVFYLQLFFQGEPFINRQLAEMLRQAHDRRMYTAVSTNAHFITREAADRLLDSGLDRLIISIDGTSEETYTAYRVGGSLARVLAALGHVAEARRVRGAHARMEVVLQFLVTRQNEHEIPEIRRIAAQHGASLALKTMQVYSVESAARFLPRDERYRRYRIEGGALVPKSRMADRCVRLWERSVVTWDGVVVPCCFDKNAEHPLGHVQPSGFIPVWRNEASQAFRTRILTGRRGVPMCTNCTEGLRVYR